MDAKIIVTMDTSGSMGSVKRMIAKQFYFLCKSALSKEFNLLLSLCIEHSNYGAVTTEDELFDSHLSGGTYLSSGVNLIMKEDFCNGKNILIIISDGDNWSEDNNTFIEKLNFLKDYFSNIMYVEVKCVSYMSSISSYIQDNCKHVNIIKLNENFCKSDSLQQILKVYELLGVI